MFRTKNLLWMMLSALFVLSMSDFLITRNIVQHLGNIAEFNPFLRYGIDRYGINFIVYFKLAMCLLMAGCVYFARPVVYNRIRIALIMLNLGAVAIVVYGFFCLAQL
jgi:hypothetical protein